MMVSGQWVRPGRPAGARWFARSAITAVGVVTLAVLPGCTSEGAAPVSEATAAESVSHTAAGSEKKESGGFADSSSKATSSSSGSGDTAADRGGTSSPTKGDTRAKSEAKSEGAADDETDEQLHRVIRVVDGDTVMVDIDGGESVRVIGIDTPETVHPNKPDECGGAEASATAKDLLEGKSVAVVFDESQGRHDKYDRLLAYLDVPGTGDFGETMLRAGHAKEYTYDAAYERQDTYRAAEQEARNAGKGVWGSCTQEPAQQPSQTSEPSLTPSTAPAPEPTTQAPAPPAPKPAPAAPAPGPGYTNDALTPGYSGCRQGYPGGKINGVYWWKPISC